MTLMLSGFRGFESYGAVRIFEEASVSALDASRGRGYGLRIDKAVLDGIGARTVIVVPVKDEDPFTLEMVLRAIPTVSPVVMVSASSREPVDRYSGEVELAELVGRSLGRRILVLHQFDPAWREALEGTPLESMLDPETGGVRRGKGEGMLLGVLAAAWLGAEYVGFIDSDNYVPGSVLEYSWIYYAAFSQSRTRYSMVRIIWPYKGKLASGDVYLRKRGRVSRHTNAVLNMVLTRLRRIETDIVKTGNAGEHALSVRLALSMDWAGGFAVEPYQLVWLLERCGLETEECPALPDPVEVFQVEAMNPHIHAERGDEHIAGMLATSLGTIYHSRLADEDVKSDIIRRLKEAGIEGEPPKPRIYSPRGVDPVKAVEKLLSSSSLAVIVE